MIMNDITYTGPFTVVDENTPACQWGLFIMGKACRGLDCPNKGTKALVETTESETIHIAHLCDEHIEKGLTVVSG